MAIWQYDFFLIPIDGIIDQHGCVPLTLKDVTPPDDDEMDADVDDEGRNYWHGRQVTPEIIEKIASLLPPMRSWHENALMFGESDGDKVEIWTDEFLCRIDMRQLRPELLNLLLDIGRQMNCKVVPKDSGMVMSLSRSSLDIVMRSSLAARYVQDPERCLTELPDTDSGGTGVSGDTNRY